MARSYRRRGRRWQDPCSPLQAARFARQWTGQNVCDRIQAVCPGHNQGHCKVETSKLSDWERGARPPSVVHIQALCEVFQASAEDLGLITWHKNPDPPADGTASDAAASCRCHHDFDPREVVLDWVRGNAVTVIAEAIRALAQQSRGSGERPDRSPEDDRG